MNYLAIAIAEKKVPPRPTRHDDDIKNEVAYQLATLLNKSDGEMLIDDCYSDLYALFSERDIPDDGYVLAKALENIGWEIDADLVQLLDYVSLITSQAVERAVQDWVTAHNITAPYPAGTRIQWRQTPFPELETGVIDATVKNGNRLNDYGREARAAIKEDGKTTTGRRLVEWEKLELMGDNP